MSTRANVVVKDTHSAIYLYRHSDGYPEGIKETIGMFIERMRDGKIRSNARQSAGFLIIYGHNELREIFRDDDNGFMDWKVGSYEPTDGIHSDVEYIYVVDITPISVTVRVKEVSPFSFDFEEIENEISVGKFEEGWKELDW